MSGFQKNFGLRVKELRKRNNYTQDQLSEKLGIGVRSLSKIETGASFPSMDTLEKMIEIFEIPTAEFFDFEHLQPKTSLKELIFDMINSNPDKIQDIYKVVKALTS